MSRKSLTPSAVRAPGAVAAAVSGKSYRQPTNRAPRAPNAEEHAALSPRLRVGRH